MNLFARKMRLFCVSNIMVSFVCTGFLGIKTNTGVITESTTDEAHEISLTASDTEPVSHLGEGEEYSLAFITKSVEATITQQEDTVLREEEMTKSEFAFITSGVKAVISQQEKALGDEKKVEKKTTKTSTKKTSTTKTSTKKTTTSGGTKKETSKSSYSKPSYSSVTGDAIVSFAKQFMGLRYRSGTPSLTKGADCSGFTMLIYKEFGVSLPRTVGGQASKGKYVAKKDLQKGDLVFYKAKGAKGGPTHVGIYYGGGQVIHESRPGVGVKLSTVNMMQYVTARRVINSNSVKIAEQKLEAQKKNEVVTDNTSNTTNNTNVETTKPTDNNVNNSAVVNNNTNTTTNNTDTNNSVVNSGSTNNSTSTSTPSTTESPKEPVLETTPKVEEPKVESNSTEESN